MIKVRVLYKFFICTIAWLLLSPMATAGEKVNQTIDLGGSRAVTWYLPDVAPTGWVYLQHGFQRNKSHLDDIATHYMNNGLMVLTANSSVTGGNASLARSIADDLIDAPPTPPSGYTLPARLVLSGHSAGGLFVTNMGARLVERGYSNLEGMVLFDPVDAGNDMGPNMQSVVNSGAPVLAILANSSSCNSSNNALSPLRSLSDAFVGIRLTDNSKHFDVEGSSGGGWVTWLCGGGSKAHNIAYVQEIGLQWTTDMISGVADPAYYPGGARIQELIAINDAVLIKEISGPEAPNADFQASVSGLSVSFTNQSTDSDGSITSYSWAFGDGLVSTQANPTHTYGAAGTYTVQLTVTDDDGETDTISKQVSVAADDDDDGNLQSGVPVTGLSASWGRELEFAINVPSGSDSLTISIADGSGDADLYVRQGQRPTTRSYDYRPYLFGNEETVNVNNPQAGTWYIMIRAYRAFSGVTLTATISGDTNQTQSAKGAGVSYDVYKKLQSHNDLCLTLAEVSGGNADVVLQGCSSGTNNAQLWSLTAAGQLQPKADSSLCLAPGGAMAFATACDNTLAQQWDYKEGHLISRYDNQTALEADSSGEVVVSAVSDSDSQQWQFAGSLDKWLILLGLVLLGRSRKGLRPSFGC